MAKRWIAVFLTISLMLISTAEVSAQNKNATDNWDTLDSHLNREIAVKAVNGKTVFGILSAVTADGLTIRTADRNNASITSLKREDVEKIWLAELNPSSRNTLLGAGIGAAAGAVLGAVALSANRDEGGGGFGAAVPAYAAAGAVVGGVAGFFVRKKNKKKNLIYSK